MANISEMGSNLARERSGVGGECRWASKRASCVGMASSMSEDNVQAVKADQLV